MRNRKDSKKKVGKVNIKKLDMHKKEDKRID